MSDQSYETPGEGLTPPDRAQLMRLVQAGLEGYSAREADSLSAYERAKSTFDRAWHNASPAVRTEFETKCERPGRSRGRRS